MLSPGEYKRSSRSAVIIIDRVFLFPIRARSRVGGVKRPLCHPAIHIGLQKMKRDMEFVRAILLAIEACDEGENTCHQEKIRVKSR